MVPFRKSLAFRVLVISYILFALPLLVDSFILLNARYKAALGDAKKYLDEMNRIRELPLSEIFPSRTAILGLIENAFHLKEEFPDKSSLNLNNRLDEIVKSGEFSLIELLKYTDEGKYIVVGSSNGSDIGRDDTDFVKAVDIENRHEETNIIYVAEERKHFFLNIRPVYGNKNNKLEGLIVIYTDVSEALNLLLMPDTDRYPIFFAILFEDTLIYAASDPSLIFQYLKPISSAEKAKVLNELKIREIPKEPLAVSSWEEYPYFEFTWENQQYLGYIHDISNTPFSLLTYTEKRAIYSYLFNNFFHIYGVYFFILFFGGLLSFIIAKRLAYPLIRLSTVMENIQQGRTEERVKIDRFGFEINILSQTFNEMMDTVVEKEKVIEEERVKWEIYRKELLLGEDLQKRLYMNKKIFCEGVDVATRYSAAKEVGGDFCDLLLNDGKLVLMIADAAGKGVEACFYSLLVRGMLRIFSRELNDVAQIIKKTNDIFVKDAEESGFFTTVLLAIFDPKTKIFKYYSAGHNPFILRRKDGSTEILGQRNMALGVPYNHEKEESVFLHEGDLILFYTDGVTEAHDEHNNLFTEKRLIEIVKKEGSISVDHLVDAILKEVNAFEGKAQQHDDITLIAMKVYS